MVQYMYNTTKSTHRCIGTSNSPLVFSDEHGGEMVLDTYDKVAKLFKGFETKGKTLLK